jgi:hypothetical protein
MQEKFEKKKKPFKFKRSFAGRKPERNTGVSYFKPEIAPALKNVLAQIGKPHPTPFVTDDFQIKSLE